MIDQSAFKAVVGRFATGVTVVTTRDGQGNLAGLTANAFASVSVDPPLVLVCLDEGSQTCRYLKAAGVFAVHILAEGQEHLARRFADRGRDKSLLVDWRVGDHGTPSLRHCLASMECRVVHQYRGGDHVIVVGGVERLHVDPEQDKPLLYYRGALGGLTLIRLRSGEREISWGGATQDAQRAAWSEDFTTATGITVVQEGPTDYDAFRREVEADTCGFDLLDVEADFAYRAAADGLLEPLDFSIIDSAQIDPELAFEHGVACFQFALVLAYNEEVLPRRGPESWADLLDTRRFPGRRALYRAPSPGALEAALIADGVPASKLYPLDLPRAFAALDRVRDELVFWSYGAESQRMLATGGASMGMFWHNRIYDLMKEEAPVRMVWRENLAMASYLVVPRGVDNRRAVMQFIAHALSAESQTRFANLAAIGPVNRNAMTRLDPEVAPHLPTSHRDDRVTLDLGWWARHGAEVAKQWKAWLPPPG